MGDSDALGRDAAVLSALHDGRERSRLEIERATGMTQATTGRVLSRLVAAGLIEATAAPRSPQRKYRLTTPHNGS